MTLVAGMRFGPYELISPLGTGGMGEVYRARDTRLKRDVALKLLPTTFASDPDRLARFEHEAQTLAALNHPHIAQVFGLEESGGTCALAIELVPGETLAVRRDARWPMPARRRRRSRRQHEGAARRAERVRGAARESAEKLRVT